jgi:hypothetical protein
VITRPPDQNSITETATPDETRRDYVAERFNSPFWNVWGLISWVAYRTPSDFCLIANEDRLEAAKLYGNTVLAMKEKHPESVILDALQTGALAGLLNGGELPRETWAGRRLWDVGDIQFRREDVLKTWPNPLNFYMRSDIGHPPAIRQDGVDTFPIQAIADRWQSALSGSTIGLGPLALGLVEVLLAGAFERFPDDLPRSPSGALPAASEPSSPILRETFDQNDRVVLVDDLLAYLTGVGDSDGSRLILARDVRLSLTGLNFWWWVRGGKDWARGRGLPVPWFVGAQGSQWGHPFQAMRERAELGQKRNDRFRRKQRVSGRWFGFAEIADWLARDSGGVMPDPGRRAYIYQLISRSLLDGEFDSVTRDRSLTKVLWLSPVASPQRLSAEILSGAVEAYGADYGEDAIVVTAYLGRSWLPRDLYHRWSILCGFPLLPLFEMTDRAMTACATRDTPRSKPPGPKPGRSGPLKTLVPELVAQVLTTGSIPLGRGRRERVIEAISALPGIKGFYSASGIAKALGDAIQEWERLNPGK